MDVDWQRRPPSRHQPRDRLLRRRAWCALNRSSNRFPTPEYKEKKKLLITSAGTNPQTNRNALLALTKNAIFTNVALTTGAHSSSSPSLFPRELHFLVYLLIASSDNDVWWEGLTNREEMPDIALDWHGKPYSKSNIT